MTENAGFPNFCSFPAHFRHFSGIFFSQIFNSLTVTLTSLFPEHFEWLTGAVPQFVALILEHRLILFLMKPLAER